MTAVYETIYKTIVSPGGRSLFVKIRPRDCAPVNNSGRSFIERLIDAIWSDLDSFLRLVLVSTTTISVIDPIVLSHAYVHPTMFLETPVYHRRRYVSPFLHPFTFRIPLYSNLLYLAQFIINIEKKEII